MLTSKKCGEGGRGRDCAPQIWLQNFLSAASKKSEENLWAAGNHPRGQMREKPIQCKDAKVLLLLLLLPIQ